MSAIGRLRCVLALCALVPLSPVLADELSTWNDGAAKQAIESFVTRVTKAGGPDFVPPSERIAVFDNDGTLWAEQPIYFQVAFALDQVNALAPKHPQWRTQEPFASILKGDTQRALTGGEHSVLQIIAATHAGMTTDEFEDAVKKWIYTARHPRFKRPYIECVYQPMIELMQYLRANGFKTFIVSGGGVEFMRVWAEEVYGVPPEQVIGSSGKQKYEIRDGRPVLVKLAELDFIDDGAGKPVGIQKFIGRRPIAAFGNSDGDQQMLQWTAAGEGARLAVLVHHTDNAREWAYDRQSHVGKLDKALEEARAKQWTIVSMKEDWKTVFPLQSGREPSD